MRKMIQKSLSIIILCITIVTFRTAPSHAQSEWEKTYGGAENDAGYHIEKTHDGNYVIVGYTESFGAGGKDVWLLKINDSGDTLWTRTYGGPADDVGNKVRLAPDNGFIIAGYTESFGAGKKDVYLIKTDEYGDTLWTRTYGDSLDDVGNSVVVDDLGNSYLVGYLTRLPEDNWPIHKDIIIIFTNWKGHKSFEKRMDYGYGDFANDIYLDKNRFIICGSSAIKKFYDWDMYDYNRLETILFSIQNSNEVVWFRKYKTILDIGSDSYIISKSSNNNNFLICGKYGTASLMETSYCYVLKINRDGGIIFESIFNFGEYNFEIYTVGKDVEEDIYGNAVVTGFTNFYAYDKDYDMFMTKINCAGDTFGTHFYGGSEADSGFSMVRLQDGEFLISV